VYPWTHPFVVSSLCIAAILIPWFLYVEKHHDRPILPLDLILSPPHLNIILASFCLTHIANSLLFNIPLFYRAVLFESPSTTGFRLIIILSASSISGAATGVMIAWTRRLKWPLVTGTSIMFVGTICIVYGLRREIPPTWQSLALLCFSLGQGFCFPGTVMAILGVSTQAQQAVVSSALLLSRNLGNVMGVAVSSLLLQTSLLQNLNVMVTGPDKDEVGTDPISIHVSNPTNTGIPNRSSNE
jgi:hypothetical protein